MKYLLVVFAILTCPGPLLAQRYFIRGSDSAGYFCFHRIEGNVLTSYKESYAVLGGSKYNFMTRWGISDNGVLYWTNGESIFRCDWESTKKSRLIYSGLHWILEFVVINENIYVVYNPTKKEGFADNRYSEGLRFCRINIRTSRKEELYFPANYNATGLTISKNERWLSFVTTPDYDAAKYFMILYDISSRRIRTIDSASVQSKTSFGNYDMLNSAYWTDSVNFFYVKSTGMKGNPAVITVNVKDGTKRIWMDHFPERDFSWFAVYDNCLYSSDRHRLYRSKDGLNKETLYRSPNLQANLLDAIILPSP